ncbi:ankyrin repeat domain-containing protein [Aquicella siphonis]|uniref:ankyrin repeat domain-containing protein n=1 Tax=Aquicella siphonis TaxID=254247 RepID=UPI00155A1215|nr:ankyrin repeat domain-containing protein [Aquicella siphonis]
MQLLEKHEVLYNLSEVEAIISDPSISQFIRYTAYLYLVAQGTLESLRKLSSEMDFSYYNSAGLSAVLIAIRSGRSDVLSWLLENTDSSLQAKDSQGRGAVLTAIAFNQPDILEKLVKPQSENGYGLSLDESDINGYGAVITAVLHERAEMLQRLTKSRRHGGYGLPINATDNYGNNAVLIAAAKGRQAILRELTKSKKKGGFGLSIKAKNHTGNDTVLISVANGQMATLTNLLKKKKQGGYGRKLQVKNNHGSCPVLTAIGNGQIEMLRWLVKTRTEGGGGLSLPVQNNRGYDALQIAVINDQLDMLRLLLSDKSENGFGLIANDIRILLQIAAETSERIYLWLVMYEFEQRTKAHSSHDAIAWASVILNDFEFCREKLKSMLIARYREILQGHLDQPAHNKPEIHMLTDAVEKLSAGDGRLYCASHFIEYSDFTAAFEYYHSVFADPICAAEKREQAGIELTNMIYNGYIVISDGKLDISKSKARMQIKEPERRQEGKNLEIMRQRVIWAYEFLHNNSSAFANSMRNRFNIILSDILDTTCVSEPDWSADSVRQFYEYYSRHNAAMLTEAAFKRAFQNMTKLLEAQQTGSLSIKSADSTRQNTAGSTWGLFGQTKDEPRIQDSLLQGTASKIQGTGCTL